MIVLQTFNQQDTKWGSKIMRPSVLNMAQWGCLVTAFCMGAKNYAISDDPGLMCDKFSANGVFDNLGNFIQPNISRVYPHVFHKERIITTVEPNPQLQKMLIDVALARIRRYIDLGQPVMLNVDLVDQDKNADHWVVAYGHTDNDFIINDPAFGDMRSFRSRYGEPKTAIYGFSAFIGQPIEFPASGSPGAGQALAKLAEAKAGFAVQQNINGAIDAIIAG